MKEQKWKKKKEADIIFRTPSQLRKRGLITQLKISTLRTHKQRVNDFLAGQLSTKYDPFLKKKLELSSRFDFNKSTIKIIIPYFNETYTLEQFICRICN